ncbi:MAG: secretion protein HlyD [Propionivibrio sp.]
MMNAKRRVLIVVLLLAIGGAAWWLTHRAEEDETQLTLYGNVDIREVELAFRQAGRLDSMKVDEGDRVAQGDLLAILDARPYADALRAADADMQRAQAELAKLRQGNRIQDVRRAEAGVVQAAAVLRNLEADLKRQNELAVVGAASRKTQEAARSARDEAVAVLAAARQTLSLQKEGARHEDIAAAAAGVAAAEAARAQARTALADTRLLAPSDGVVLARVREPGAMLSNRDTVYTLSLPSPLYVRAYVAEPDLGAVAPGTAVEVTSDSSQKIYHGQIGFVSPRAEFTPKSVETTQLRTDLVYRVRIVVAEADSGLRQGMPVTVRVENTAARLQE